MAEILTPDRIETGKTIDSYVNSIIEPDEFRAFNKLGEILNYKTKDGKNPLHEHSFVFLFIERALFKYYTSKKKGEKDKLNIRNPRTDICGKMTPPINIYNNFIRIDMLYRAVNHEGIFVLDRTSGNITNNGLIIPIDFEDLYIKFGVNDDIKLIEKTGYPISNTPEIGTKSKAMLYFSIYHPEVSFMKFDGDCYIIKKGKVAYLHKENDFKNSGLSPLLP